MTTKTKTEQALPGAVTEEKAEPPKFELARLRKDCLRLFGVTVSTFDGAAYELKGEFTVKELHEKIQAWQNTRVHPAKKKEID